LETVISDLKTINQLRSELAAVEPDVVKAEAGEVRQSLDEAKHEFHHGTVERLELAVAFARCGSRSCQKKAGRELCRAWFTVHQSFGLIASGCHECGIWLGVSLTNNPKRLAGTCGTAPFD
jgi:hypothetical protein